MLEICFGLALSFLELKSQRFVYFGGFGDLVVEFAFLIQRFFDFEEHVKEDFV
tara:strand:+ start:361 stop:519 length:159 start_codon:yes stop_codon:yes gene_type:complete